MGVRRPEAVTAPPSITTKRTLTVTLPNGFQIIKNTTVAYAYVVAVQTPSGNWFDARWCRSLPLAQKAAGTIWPSYPDRRIVPVTLP